MYRGLFFWEEDDRAFAMQLIMHHHPSKNPFIVNTLETP